MSHSIDKCQFVPSGAGSVDIGHNGPWFGLVVFIRKLLKAGLADAEVTEIIIKDPSVADCSANSTDIADEVDVLSPLKSKFMAYGALLLAAGRYSAGDTVKFLANPAHWPA